MRIQFLFQRHNFNVTDVLLKTVEQKVVTFFFSRFNENRIREQLDDMRTPVRLCIITKVILIYGNIKTYVINSNDQNKHVESLCLFFLLYTKSVHMTY